jgi:hypothetical protein
MKNKVFLLLLLVAIAVRGEDAPLSSAKARTEERARFTPP